MRLGWNRTFSNLVFAAAASAIALAPLTLAPSAFAQAGEKESLLKKKKSPKKPIGALGIDAEKKIQEMRTVLTGSEKRLDEARKSKDVLQIECVAEKLPTIKGVLRIAEKAQGKMVLAVAKSNEAKARNEMRKVNAASNKAVELGAAIRNCVGSASFDGSTEVEVEVDESIGESDPYYGNPDHFSSPNDAIVDGDNGTVGQDNTTVSPPPPPTTGFQ